MITLTAEADLTNYSGVTLFTDIEPTAWYAPSMEWASDNGIIKGVSETLFSPNDAITREEAAVMLHRLATFEKSDVLKDPMLTVSRSYYFIDEAKISVWAKKKVDELRKVGILLGDTNKDFNPQDSILRSEAAKSLSSYIVFDSKPTLITGGTGATEYIKTSDDDITNNKGVSGKNNY